MSAGNTKTTFGEPDIIMAMHGWAKQGEDPEMAVYLVRKLIEKYTSENGYVSDLQRAEEFKRESLVKLAAAALSPEVSARTAAWKAEEAFGIMFEGKEPTT